MSENPSLEKKLKRFCIVPLMDFKTSLADSVRVTDQIELARYDGQVTELADLYETSFTAGPWRVFTDPEREKLQGVKWVLQYHDEIPEAEARNSNHKEPVQALQHFLVAMQLVQPTTARNRWMFCGFHREPKKDVTLIHFANDAKLTRSQRRGAFRPEDIAAAKKVWDTLNTVLARDTQQDRMSKVTTAIRAYMQALHANDFEPRLVLLCTALEAIFTTQTQEVSFLLRTRLARWLATDPADRTIRYKRTKQIYAMRSTIVHGGDWTQLLASGNVNEQNRALDELLDDADRYVREAICRIMSNVNLVPLFTAKNTESLDKMWDEVMLS